MHAVKKIYDRPVLFVEHLKLHQGCIYGIIGPSGSGKSTLLRIINLLTPPSTGKVFYHGKELTENQQERLYLQRKMALVFQKTLLFKDSVWNNVAFGLKARGHSKTKIKTRVDQLLEQVGLSEYAHRRADTLSGGEAQRVAIARAIAFEPDLLLLDEPTANLDPGNIEKIEKIITTMAKEKKITVVMVTHNIFQAKRIADQVIFINEGRIVEMGLTADLFNEPQEESTRLFVEGRMIY